jgi:hypothetical protein
MLLSLHQNAGHSHFIKTANRCFKIVAHVKYLGITVTNQNIIQEKIKRRLNSGNGCYHSVQNILSSRLLSKSVKVILHKTIILPVVLYGCETLSLILREEHRVFENRVLKRIFRIKVNEVTEGWRKLHNEELYNFYTLSNIIGMIMSRKMRWAVQVARIGEKWNAYRILVGKQERKRPL